MYFFIFNRVFTNRDAIEVEFVELVGVLLRSFPLIFHRTLPRGCTIIGVDTPLEVQLAQFVITALGCSVLGPFVGFRCA